MSPADPMILALNCCCADSRCREPQTCSPKPDNCPPNLNNDASQRGERPSQSTRRDSQSPSNERSSQSTGNNSQSSPDERSAQPTRSAPQSTRNSPQPTTTESPQPTISPSPVSDTSSLLIYSPADPIILVAFLLCIAYFLKRIVDSFNDEFTIKLDEKLMEEQLKKWEIEKMLWIEFGFDKRYEFNAIKDVSISIRNKTGIVLTEKEKEEKEKKEKEEKEKAEKEKKENEKSGKKEPEKEKSSKDETTPEKYSIYVDWDHSAFTDLEKRSRRVTRLMPGTTLDLFQAQAYSTIAPNTTLKEKITAEDLLQRKGERKEDKLDSGSPMNLEVEITKPLINLEPEKPSDALKKELEKFKKVKAKHKLEFYLELAFRIVGPSTSLGGDRVHILCKFILEKLPWHTGVPWNPRK